MLQLIREHARVGAFGPEAIPILVAAFDAAWARLEKSGAKLGEHRTQIARETLAKSIIKLAETGERDPRRLCDQALLDYAQSTRKDAPQK
jgi:hypothetical protein